VKWVHSNIMRLRLAPHALLPGFYLAFVRGSSPVVRYLRKVNHGATRDGINTEQLLNMPVALPPLAEQEQIVAEVERRLSILQEVEAEVEANLKRAARLRQAILKRAFEGKLVPQDPTDEPASERLARIRAERERSSPAQRRKKKPARNEPAEAQPGLF
jgi:type I restriction enzyme, S subunit